MTRERYRRIIDTAKFPAFLRTFSDIPYAPQVYAYLQSHSPGDSQIASGLIYDDFIWLAPNTEARQRAITKRLNERHYDLVIELGSGFSLRWCQLNTVRKFIDTDLAETVYLKANMLKHLGLPLPPSVALKVLNPFETDLLSFVKEHFPTSQSVAIVHEGLAQYFDKLEVSKLCKNILRLSGEVETEWLSTDFSTLRQIAAHHAFDPNMKALTTARQLASGRDLSSNAFDDEVSIESFFKDRGFEADSLKVLDYCGTLTCFEKITIDRERFVKIFRDHLRIWSIRPRAKPAD